MERKDLLSINRCKVVIMLYIYLNIFIQTEKHQCSLREAGGLESCKNRIKLRVGASLCPVRKIHYQSFPDHFSRFFSMNLLTVF